MLEINKSEDRSVVSIVNNKLRLEIPITTLERRFNERDGSFTSSKIKKGCRKEFAEHLVDIFIDDHPFVYDPLTEVVDGLFGKIAEDGYEFIDYTN